MIPLFIEADGSTSEHIAILDVPSGGRFVPESNCLWIIGLSQNLILASLPCSADLPHPITVLNSPPQGGHDHCNADGTPDSPAPVSLGGLARFWCLMACA